jgi:hypothetical protein
MKQCTSIVLIACCAWGSLTASPPLDPDSGLRMFRRSISETLRQATNYVCTQSVHRYAFDSTSKRYPL